MKQLEDRHYIADDCKIIIRTEDNMKFGTEIYLAVNDSIDNYSEIDMTDEDRACLESQKHEHKSTEEEKRNKQVKRT